MIAGFGDACLPAFAVVPSLGGRASAERGAAPQAMLGELRARCSRHSVRHADDRAMSRSSIPVLASESPHDHWRQPATTARGERVAPSGGEGAEAMQSGISKRKKNRPTIILGAAMLSTAVGFSARAESASANTEESAATASAQMCPSPMPVPPQTDPVTGKKCHPSMCTPSFCSRGDIAPLGSHAATKALQDRLVKIDCSPHSVTPLQIFA